MTEAGLTGTSSANPNALLILLNLLGLVLVGGLVLLGTPPRKLVLPGSKGGNPKPPLLLSDIFFSSARISSRSSTFLLSRDSLSIPETNVLPPSAFFSIVDGVSLSVVIPSCSTVLSIPLDWFIFSRSASTSSLCFFMTSSAEGFRPNIFSIVNACLNESLNPRPSSVFIIFRQAVPPTLPRPTSLAKVF